MRRKIKHGLYVDWNKASFRGIFAWALYGFIMLDALDNIVKLIIKFIL